MLTVCLIGWNAWGAERQDLKGFLENYLRKNSKTEEGFLVGNDRQNWLFVARHDGTKLDNTFAEQGIYSDDLWAMSRSNKTKVLPTGEILVAGIAKLVSLPQETVKPLLFKLTPEGTWVDDFSDLGYRVDYGPVEKVTALEVAGDSILVGGNKNESTLFVIPYSLKAGIADPGRIVEHDFRSSAKLRKFQVSDDGKVEAIIDVKNQGTYAGSFQNQKVIFKKMWSKADLKKTLRGISVELPDELLEILKRFSDY